MRILCAALASPGFLYPLIAIARTLRGRGHDIRFVTDRRYAEDLQYYDFDRCPRGPVDGTSFGVATWFEPSHVALQLAHLRYAAESFAPDIILSSQLTLGPVFLCHARDIPLVILGPIVYLWPLTDANASSNDPAACEARWRLGELQTAFDRARDNLRYPESDDVPLLGDRYLLQTVRALEAGSGSKLPPHVRLVGSCLHSNTSDVPDSVALGLDRARKVGHKTVFVQLGRTFGNADPWPVLETWACNEDILIIASLDRYDGPIGPTSDRIYLQNGISLDAVVPEVDLVICSGTPSPLLAAATHGKPVLVLTGGSGTEQHAGAFTRYGSALALAAAEIHPACVKHATSRLLRESSFKRRALSLQDDFKHIDGPSRAADELELAAELRNV